MKVRKTSQRKSAAQALDDLQPSGHGWRKDAIAAVVAATALTAVVVNAAFLQTGPHPAPMFASKPVPSPVPAPRSIRVVGQEITGPAPQIALQKSRAAETEAPTAIATSSVVTSASSPATAGFRRHQSQARSHAGARRARIQYTSSHS